MSTSSTDEAGAVMVTGSSTFDVSSTPPVPLLRLIAVECRKMVDTRAGRWLLGITGGLLLIALGLTLVVMVLVDEATITAQGLAEIMVIPLSLLLPVLAIVSVTSEWGQRTHLVTFTLEPRRLRIVIAKLGAVLILGLAAIAAALVFGALGNVLYGMLTGNEVVWNLDLTWLGWTALTQLLFFLMAFGLSMVLLSTPAAIAVVYVVSLLLPMMVYSVLFVFFGWARELLPWIAMDYAFMPFVSEINPLGEPYGDPSGVDYARIAVSVTLWVIVPLVVGTMRVLRSEVK